MNKCSVLLWKNEESLVYLGMAKVVSLRKNL